MLKRSVITVAIAALTRALRVRYGKDFESIKVETSRGRTGWVVGGGGVRVVSRGGQNGV
jgi:hypothetical protein